jgi:hypothetical protein
MMPGRPYNPSGIVFGGPPESGSNTPAPMSGGDGSFVFGYPPPTNGHGYGHGPGLVPGHPAGHPAGHPVGPPTGLPTGPPTGHLNGHPNGHPTAHPNGHAPNQTPGHAPGHFQNHIQAAPSYGHGHGYGPGSYGQPHQFHSPHPSDLSQMMYPSVMTPPNGYGYPHDQMPHGQYAPRAGGYYMPTPMDPHYAMYTSGPWLPHPRIPSNGYRDARSTQASSPEFDTENTGNNSQREPSHHSNPSIQSNSLDNSMNHSRSASRIEASFGPGPTVQLQDHLLAQFDNPQMSDVFFTLQKTDPGSGNEEPIATFNLHSLTISRSPLLERLLLEQTQQPAHPKTIRLSVDDHIATAPEAFGQVLRTIYGGPFIETEPFLDGLPPVHAKDAPTMQKHVALHKMDHIIAYLATCILLELPDAYRHAASVLPDLLRWDNVEAALNFALDLPAEKLWTLSNNEARGFLDQSPRSTDQLVLTKETAQEDVLRAIINFICAAFPPNFVMDTRTTPLDKIHRFPPMADDQKPYVNPIVTRIQFGQVEPEEKDWVSTQLSRILLSLPLSTLDRIFRNQFLGNHLTWPNVVKAMRAAVEERESRRARFLTGRSAEAAKAAVDLAKQAGLLDNLTRREFVEKADHPSGFSIQTAHDPVENHIGKKKSAPLLEIEDGKVKSFTF